MPPLPPPPVDSHDGRVAIVTGGGSGIGRATAVHLALRGATVVVADVDEARAHGVAVDAQAAGLVIHGRGVDVSDARSVNRMVQDVARTFGGVDLLFNAAADTSPATVGRDADLLAVPDEVWQRSIDVNLTGSMLMCRACIPSMIERGRGSIVNMLSVAALAGNLSLTAYATTKAGLLGLTRSIATQYGRAGVRCNAIAAGFVRTESTAANLTPEVEVIIRDNTLVGFLGEPDDVAAAASFLLSDAARYITGEVLRVDGGQLAHVPTYESLARLAERGRGSDAR